MSWIDWSTWHAGYDDPHTPLARRLHAVQQRILEALDRCPPGEVRIISRCAGQDLLGACSGFRAAF